MTMPHPLIADDLHMAEAAMLAALNRPGGVRILTGVLQGSAAAKELIGEHYRAEVRRLRSERMTEREQSDKMREDEIEQARRERADRYTPAGDDWYKLTPDEARARRMRIDAETAERVKRNNAANLEDSE